MHSEHLDAPCAAPGTGTEPTPEARQSHLTYLIQTNRTTLTASAYEGFADLLLWDFDNILATLAKRLPRYTGPTDEGFFLRWAARFVKREAQRYAILTRILSEQDRVIHSAIHRALWTSATDLAVEHSDLYWQVAMLIFQHAHSLNQRGTAKLSTRLTALVKTHLRFHNAKNARRWAAVKAHTDAGLSICREEVSALELASLRPHADPWEPGYSEVGIAA